MSVIKPVTIISGLLLIALAAAAATILELGETATLLSLTTAALLATLTDLSGFYGIRR